jgi:Amt family ammonium transporter
MANDGTVEQKEFAQWFYQYTVAVFATTVSTSALTERGSLVTYVVVAALFSGGIYPVIVHWVWASNGWLSVMNVGSNFAHNGMMDQAGSGVVHLTAAAVAVILSYFAGPRLRRFDADFNKANPTRFQSTNKVYHGLGVLLMWVGWYGFTCTSMNLSTGRAQIMVKMAVNTTLAAAAGALMAFAFDAYFGALTPDKMYMSTHPEDTDIPLVKRTDIRATLNGVLAGLIAVSAGVAVYEPWAAFVVGGLAGILPVLAPRLLPYVKLDDPVDTFSLFGLGGFWGLFAVGWFARQENCTRAYMGVDTKYGIWYGGDAEQWGVQMFGGVAIVAWGLLTGATIAVVLRYLGYLRVTEAQDAAGLNGCCEAEVKTKEIEMTEPIKESPPEATPVAL